MTYSLDFDARALKEWKKLGDTVRQQFKKKLAEVLLNPRIEANRLHSLPDCYKIKLRSSGFRLVYQVAVASAAGFCRLHQVAASARHAAWHSGAAPAAGEAGRGFGA